AGLVLYFILIPSLAVGSAANIKYLNTWYHTVLLDDQGKSDDDFSAHGMRNQSLTNATYRLGNWVAYLVGAGSNDRAIDSVPASAAQNAGLPMDGFAARLTMRIVQLALLVLLLHSIWIAARRNDAWTTASVFALACLLMSAISPLFRGHYYVLWLPAA